MSPLRTVDLDEVNAAFATDFAVIDNADDVEMTSNLTHRTLIITDKCHCELVTYAGSCKLDEQ